MTTTRNVLYVNKKYQEQEKSVQQVMNIKYGHGDIADFVYTVEKKLLVHRKNIPQENM